MRFLIPILALLIPAAAQAHDTGQSHRHDRDTPATLESGMSVWSNGNHTGSFIGRDGAGSEVTNYSCSGTTCTVRDRDGSNLRIIPWTRPSGQN